MLMDKIRGSIARAVSRHTLKFMKPYYSRHFSLDGFSAESQDSLENSRVLIVGCGGLGNLTAMYCCTAGIGQLLINDFDSVDESNLQRQLLFAHADIGKNKAQVACDKLSVLNPDCEITAQDQRLSKNELLEICKDITLIIDCTDNFATRYLLNEVSYENKTALLSGAAIRLQGQISLFNPNSDAYACYECLFPEHDESTEDCEGNGILAPVTGVIASSMAVEAIKFITGIGESLSGRLQLYDANNSEWREIKFRQKPDCPTCGFK